MIIKITLVIIAACEVVRALQNHKQISMLKRDTSSRDNVYAEIPIATDILSRVPDAEPEIIRCKDCKHSEHWYRGKRRCFLWVEDGIDVFDDGFCNYAER